jgi:hypothetical protein
LIPIRTMASEMASSAGTRQLLTAGRSPSALRMASTDGEELRLSQTVAIASERARSAL